MRTLVGLKVLSERGRALLDAGQVVQELLEPAGKRFPKRPPPTARGFAPDDEETLMEEFEEAARVEADLATLACAGGAVKAALLQKTRLAARSERMG